MLGSDSMNKDRAYYRYYRKRAINRKLGILKRLGGSEYIEAWTGGKPGRLAKGKIHCSCWMCRSKSYDCPGISDLRKLQSAEQQLKEDGELP